MCQDSIDFKREKDKTRAEPGDGVMTLDSTWDTNNLCGRLGYKKKIYIIMIIIIGLLFYFFLFFFSCLGEEESDHSCNDGPRAAKEEISKRQRCQKEIIMISNERKRVTENFYVKRKRMKRMKGKEKINVIIIYSIISKCQRVVCMYVYRARRYEEGFWPQLSARQKISSTLSQFDNKNRSIMLYYY